MAFIAPNKDDSHYRFWLRIKEGGKVWRDDPLNNKREWLTLSSLNNDPNEICRYGHTGLYDPHHIEDLFKLWKKLGDVPTFPESTEEFDVDSIEEPFLHFGIGTHREDIWHWFEAQHPEFLVGKVMSGNREKLEHLFPTM